MKKILLSVALIAMSVFSMSALSFKVEVNGVEVKEGDEIELTEDEKVKQLEMQLEEFKNA